MKNRVNSFDLFVRLDEQESMTDESSIKMLKSKLKSIVHNSTSSISAMESHAGMTVDPFIIAKIAVAADYMEEIEEFFRNYEGEGMPMDAQMGVDENLPDGAEEDMDFSNEGGEEDQEEEDQEDTEEEDTEEGEENEDEEE